MSPGLIFVQKAVLLSLSSGELIFGGAYYGKEFCVSKWVELDNKTASNNSPWAYLWEGLLSEGCLRLSFGGLIFGRTYFFFFGGGGLIIGILQYIKNKTCPYHLQGFRYKSSNHKIIK